MKYSGKVLIEKVTEKAGIKSTRNPKGVDNVNVAQGPKTGNVGRSGKRGEFQTAKEQRAPLATVIEAAFGYRGESLNSVDKKLEPVSSNSRRKFGK